MNVAILGGGAAGIFAAIRCASTHPGARVVVLEGTRRPLTKLRISGGGRCNVTHHCFEPKELVRNYPRGSRELLQAFHRFQPQDTVRWFEERGVPLKVEADGRMFPTTDSSETVAACLLGELKRLQVELRLGAIVRAIARENNGFTLSLQGGAAVFFDKLVLATGGAPAGYELARKLGHEIVPLVPSLFTFMVKDPRLAELAGVSFPRATLALKVDGESETFEAEGPLLITHWGLSGPAVLRISAFAARALHASGYRGTLRIGILPGVNADAAFERIARYKETHARRGVAGNPAADVPKRFWEKIAAPVGAKTYADVTKLEARALADELTRGAYAIHGKGEFKEEFVTAGGVALKEVDFRTMQSKIVPGLFFAGEILDVDGVTGGFNFQNAWTTAWIAGSGHGG